MSAWPLAQFALLPMGRLITVRLAKHLRFYRVVRLPPPAIC